jgi:hypothetical protein
MCFKEVCHMNRKNKAGLAMIVCTLLVGSVTMGYAQALGNNTFTIHIKNKDCDTNSQTGGQKGTHIQSFFLGSGSEQERLCSMIPKTFLRTDETKSYELKKYYKTKDISMRFVCSHALRHAISGGMNANLFPDTDNGVTFVLKKSKSNVCDWSRGS